jgi:hypothetical protein
MNTRGWIVAAGLVVAVNAFVLARVAWNRHAIEGSLTLTEREMPVAFVSPSSESSGVALRLDVEHWAPWAKDRYTRDPELDPLAWLDAGKLASLGFDVELPSDGEEAAIFVRRQLPRDAYAVLEHEGRAWDAYRKRIAERFGLVDPDSASALTSPADRSDRAAAERELRFGSRLFIVDVGTDPAALRAQYPDRNAYVIAPAKVQAYLDRDPPWARCPSSCRLRGSVSLLIDEVSVPLRLQRALPTGSRPPAALDRPGEHAPRYEISLRSGSRYEPWIEAITPVGS